MARQPFDIGSAQQHFSKLPPIVRDMIEAAARQHGVDKLLVVSSCQREEAVRARDQVVRVLNGKFSAAAMGRFLRKDHSSILSSKKRNERDMKRGQRIALEPMPGWEWLGCS